jgi:DNA replication initiation complex subunit (GINS family)
MQLEIDCYEWVIGKIELNKIPFDILERIIRATIKDLEKRKDKAMVRTDTDNLWTKIESRQWVLFVIFDIRNGKMVVF